MTGNVEKMAGAIVLIASFVLSGCAPIISGAMNATLDENAVIEKTAKYFGSSREKITISSIDKGALATSYKATYAGKIYNCSIYYGQVTCTQAGVQDDLSATKSSASQLPAALPSALSNTSVVATMTPAQVQARLNQLGYPVGSPDGIFGKKSIEGLKSFQKDRGLPVSGKLDSATISALQ